jgi:hypothetical protein
VLERPLECLGVGIEPGHLGPQAASRRKPNRAADQPYAEDRDSHPVENPAARGREAEDAAGMTQTVLSSLPATSATLRTCSAYSAKRSVAIACGPSQIASSGSLWTSTITPSAPAAAAASDIG